PARVRNLAPGVRLIALLRHPVDRAYSRWLHSRHYGREPLACFADAWAAEPARIAAGWSPIWHYRRLGCYASQLRHWLQHFPSEQLLVLFHEDWRNRPAETLARAWRHIGLEPVIQPEIKQLNITSRRPYSIWLNFLTRQEYPARDWIRRRVPLRLRSAIAGFIRRV